MARDECEHGSLRRSCLICELTASLRAAEERAEAAERAMYAEMEQDPATVLGRMRDRAIAAERRAEATDRETECVRERGLVAVHNVRTQRDAMERERDAAERRAEGLEEALKKAREAGLALLGWIAVCDKQGVVPNRNSVLAQNARAILDPDLARPRSEETPTSPCGHIDEGWEEFPCTLPAGHEGKHACTATVTLTTVATDKETP